MGSRIIFVLLALLFVSPVYSQAEQSPKAHAYSREVLGGSRRVATADETGKSPTSAAKPSLQYYIYVESNSALNIKTIWIEGKQFSVATEKIATPVILQNATVPGKKADTLVKATQNNVWQVQLKDKLKDGKRTAALVRLLRNNDVVIVYERKGKLLQLPVKRIYKLSSVALS